MFRRRLLLMLSRWRRSIVPPRKAFSAVATCSGSESSKTTCCKTVRGNPDNPVADDARYPDAPFRVERQAVGIRSRAEFGYCFPATQGAIRRNSKTAQAPPEGFVDIQPLSGCINLYLVRIAQAVGHDAGASPVLQNDEAVGDVRPIAQGTWCAACTNRQPDAVVGVDKDKIGGRQSEAIDGGQNRFQGTGAPKAVEAAVVTKIGQQERAVAAKGNPVRTDIDPRDLLPETPAGGRPGRAG